MKKENNLQRFLDAQATDYAIALAEVKKGRKHSHWMWYIFPQIQGLGYSSTSQFYAIQDLLEAQAYLELDLYIGITGWICDERRGTHLREVVKHIPANRLLVETDAPYLMPRDLKPKPTTRRNEPMYLPHVLAAIASARGERSEELGAATTRNALELFGWTQQESHS